MLLQTILFLVVGAFCDQVVINEVVDQLWDGVKQGMISKGSNKIPMKPLEKNFKTKLFGMEIPAEFTARNGYLEDLATIYRTGDVIMTNEENVLNLKVSLGFHRLRVFYDQYEFKYLTLKSSGTMEISMTNSSVTAVLSVHRNGTECKVLVDRAEIDYLGPTKALLSGSHELNQFITMLLNWVIENFNDKIQVLINEKMAKGLQKALDKADLCSKLPH